MNLHFGHNKKPQDGWDVNRQSGYDWDEEDQDDFSYEDVNDAEEYEETSSEPEFIDVAPVDEEGDLGFDSLDDEPGSLYAQETEYQAEHQSFATGSEYASEPEYVAEQYSVTSGAEYASEPDLSFEQDDRDLDFVGNMDYGKPVQMGTDGNVDYAQDGSYSDGDFYGDGGFNSNQGLGDYDDGYLPALSEEDSAYGLGDGFLPPVSNADYEYGSSDGYLQPLPMDDNYSLGNDDKVNYDSGARPGFDDSEDAWEDDGLEEEFLSGKASKNENEPRRSNEFVKKDITEYANPFEVQEPEEKAQSFDDYEGEIIYVDEEDEEEPAPVRRESQARTQNVRRGGRRRSSLGVVEKIMAIAGVVVILLLAGFIGILFWKGSNKPVDVYSQFANVGTQLSNIELIGGKGIAAVANAEIAKLTPELDPLEESDDGPDKTGPDYNEVDYKTTVKVSMTLISVQKDLKIKFSNRETSKLIGNVKFVAEVTKPDGTVVEWTDADMDGIIYEEGIDPGKYSVTLKELDEDKYSNYILPASAQTVTVKKNIEYVKVDVTGEAKKETEINVSQEDTKKNETANESALTDTVTWVTSTVTGNTYTEVLKSTVPDPLTLPIKVAKNFMRIAEVIENPEGPKAMLEGEGEGGGESGGGESGGGESGGGESGGGESGGGESGGGESGGGESGGSGSDPTPSPTPETTPSPTPEATPSPTPEATPSPTPEATPSPTPSATPTASPSATPTASPSATPSTSPSATPSTSPSTTPSTSPSTTPSISPSTTPSGSPSGSPSASPSADPEGETSMELEADKVELLVTKSSDGSSTTAETATIKATVKGFVTGKELDFNAESSNKAIATVAIDANGKITIIAVAKGTAKITVTADYKNAADKPAGTETKVTKTIDVTVTEKEALTVTYDQTEVLCYSEVTETPNILIVTIKNSNLKAADLIESKMDFTAESSDTTVIQITKKEFVPSTVNGTVQVKLTLTPQVLTEKRSVFIQVKYVEGEESVIAKCPVTVKPHPKNDKVTPLLDNEGRQLFVEESTNKYREAVYADYYVENVKFFIQSGVKYTGWQTLEGKTYYYNAEGKFVTGEQVIQGAKYQFGPDGVLMSGNGVLGIDVSKWNGSINWTAVKNSGVTFVIIRCGFRGSSGGMIAEDLKFAANIKGALDAGLKVGVYFFSQAITEVEAVYEASYALDRVKNYKITYPIFIDVEASGGRGDKIDKATRTKVVKAFCQTIQNSGYSAGIYANKNWLTEKMNVSELNNYRIWLAQYASQPTYDGRYDMWQYKSTGTVSGISGNVDMNLSYMGY